MDTAVYYKAMQIAKKENIPVFAHCEDKDLVQGGVMNAGKRAEELGLPGIANVVEDVITARDIVLADSAGEMCIRDSPQTEDISQMIEEIEGKDGVHYLKILARE